MNSKGPWKQSPSSESTIRDANDKTVAYLSTEKRNWGDNFDLIVAAPELLEAAIKVLTGDRDGMNELKAAVNKAQGKVD